MEEAEIFNEHRSFLLSVAYRMLGSLVEAEDIVQDACLKWINRSDREVRSEKAFLTTLVTNLCIDALRSARKRREEYVGSWLPEPIVGDDRKDVLEQLDLADSLSTAFLFMLERLTPVERAVFLLRETFDFEYEEIAGIIGKSEANCRQIARRARERMGKNEKRFQPDVDAHHRLLTNFMQACRGGDLDQLVSLLEQDVVLYSDSGGNVRSARRPIHGSLSVARFILGLLRKHGHGIESRIMPVNGRYGVVNYREEDPYSVISIDVDGKKITGIFIQLNPEKLGSIPSDHRTPPGVPAPRMKGQDSLG